MLPIRRSLTLDMTVFLLWQQIPCSKKMNSRSSCHNIFAETRCFVLTLQLYLPQNYPAPRLSQHPKEINIEEILSSNYIIFFFISSLLDSAFQLFNSVCPHFPPPFTPIMWLTPTKRINHRRESCGSLRIAECAWPTTSWLRIDKVPTNSIKKANVLFKHFDEHSAAFMCDLLRRWFDNISMFRFIVAIILLLILKIISDTGKDTSNIK